MTNVGWSFQTISLGREAIKHCIICIIAKMCIEYQKWVLQKNLDRKIGKKLDWKFIYFLKRSVQKCFNSKKINKKSVDQYNYLSISKMLMTNKGGLLVKLIFSQTSLSTFLANVLQQLLSTFSLSIFSTSHMMATVISKRQEPGPHTESVDNSWLRPQDGSKVKNECKLARSFVTAVWDERDHFTLVQFNLCLFLGLTIFRWNITVLDDIRVALPPFGFW